MKYILGCILFVAGVSGTIAVHAASAIADQSWAEIRALMNAGPGDTKGKPQREILQWFEDREEALRAKSLAFYESFPNDMRRWEAVLTMLQRSPRFITGWSANPGKKGEETPLFDEEARQRWKVRQKELEVAMARAFPTLTRDLQERFEARPIFAEIGALFAKLEAKQPVDWPALRAKVNGHLAKYSDVPAIAGVVSRYMGMYERDHSAQETAAEWRALTINPLVRKSELVASRVDVIEREMSSPIELKFTAVDGREVDLAKMRGKVVLIDFWATWCGPCVAELPNVKKVYEAYHDKGFEVIGISLENADLKRNDTPEMLASKHRAAKRKLLDFVGSRELPWPQHYDGKYWDNEISKERFKINSVPATFLIDQQGMIAVVNVRGPQLDAEVRRLLKL